RVHQQALSLVHQDVSPSNIMVSRQGSVKLIDFGISSVKLHQKTEKKSNKLRGKIPYMAPEQLIRGSHPDHRSDIFSLGLVLFETLAGERLFNSREDVYAAGKNTKSFRKACDVSAFPRALGQIVTRALDIDITRRYQTAREMHVDLLDYLGSRSDSVELADSLSSYLTEELDKRKRKPTGTPIEPTTKATATTGPSGTQSSTHNSATSKWQELEVIENAQKNSERKQVETNPSRVTTNRITRESFITTEPASQESDYIKNIIDLLSESAKENKKRIIKVCAGLIFAALLLGLLDALTGWTQAGTWVRDIFFPQTLEVNSVPPNAQFYLDGTKIIGGSPIELSDLAPGVHQLVIRHKGYEPIMREISVGQDGSYNIKGEQANSDQSYLFRFRTDIQIDSRPQGAIVFINGNRFGKRTPCKARWEVGKPFTLTLAHSGFQKLGGFSLDTMSRSQQTTAEDSWSYNVVEQERIQHVVLGTFKKKIIFKTVPRDVVIYDVKSNRQLKDLTSDHIIVPAGPLELEVRKPGLLPKRLKLNVTEDTRDEMTVVLERNVLFTASNGTSQPDIGANLVSLKSGNSEYLRTSYQTPFELRLPAYSYTAIFSKPGYGRRQITFGPETHRVSANLAVANAIVEVQVLDALSGQPIVDADILYHAGETAANSWITMGTSDQKGMGSGELKTGKYVIGVNHRGFRPMTRPLTARAGETHRIVFKIYPSN
ncbi:MAG: PEGA domain-containing protein, partial [bacterium]